VQRVLMSAAIAIAFGKFRFVLLGPSLQVRPLPQMHLVPLIGLTEGAIAAKVFGIIGWEL
jgi:hypothetical protein